MRTNYKIILERIIIIISIIAIIIAGIFIYANLQTKLPSVAYINDNDVRNKTAKECNDILDKQLKKEKFRISIDDREHLIQINEKPNAQKDIKHIIKKSRMNLFLYYKLKDNYILSYNIKNTDVLKKDIVDQLKKYFPHTSKTIITKDADINIEDLEIQKEIQGNDLDYKKIEKEIIKTINKGHIQKKISSKDYVKKPNIRANNKNLKKKLDFYKDYLKTDIYAIYPNKDKVKLSNSQIYQIVKYNLKNRQITYNKEGISNISKELAKNKSDNKITIKTHEGNKQLKDYDRVMNINIEDAYNQIETGIKNKQNIILSYVNQNTILKNRVEVNKTKQEVYLYVNGKLKLKTNCVTGRHGHDTNEGIFAIDWKTTKTVLKGTDFDGKKKYASPVDYWMPFNDGEGLHDASWRSSFGGDIWYYNGSHGCVNLPPNDAKTIYNYVDVGTPVVVYQ